MNGSGRGRGHDFTRSSRGRCRRLDLKSNGSFGIDGDRAAGLIGKRMTFRHPLGADFSGLEFERSAGLACIGKKLLRFGEVFLPNHLNRRLFDSFRRLFSGCQRRQKITQILDLLLKRSRILRIEVP